LSNRNIRGIILSGGPASVLEPGAPNADRRFFDLKIPVLGVCYGMQLIAREYGGKLLRSESREYGRAVIEANTSSRLFRGTTSKSTVWMSHGDTISVLPSGFVATASTTDVAVAAMENVWHRSIAFSFIRKLYIPSRGARSCTISFTISAGSEAIGR
jgi:GMP synthase (glutamine-hydrolysing)